MTYGQKLAADGRPRTAERVMIRNVNNGNATATGGLLIKGLMQ
jgi:hypothetical protein